MRMERFISRGGLPAGQGGGVGKPLQSESFWPSFFARIVGRLQWDADAIDLTRDAHAWTELPDERRRRLTTLLAGFCVAEEAVSEQLAPFITSAENTTLHSDETLVAWVLFLQRRDEARHAQLMDRIAAEVLGFPGATPEERRGAAREHVPGPVLELFEEQLPAVASELATGQAGLAQGLSLYHMVLEGIVFAAGQRALLDDMDDDALPGVREGIGRIELDERWHIGFGLRLLIETRPSPELIEDLLAKADDASSAWGDAVPESTREYVTRMCRRRLASAGLLRSQAAA
ncbi:MAG TPA: hypothetical protein VGF91_25705 [Solirubrobacteraceae bacterium]